ncbi:GNAT family N-acetyltransferase [Cupriavidus sp. WKF15]|uniref:GNAT family N-acetyltransferase n=1 Tax=Cupriavidus sp. WKF15 TaxID=3032282 RepID=UPI0023E16AC8|nr:GNAT family N-acetyltransferase [Cupriavidus sp. WKF15]WER45245.1 GNAT family N-acetyltransferase [Cupriavidus sp. WKF15]
MPVALTPATCADANLVAALHAESWRRTYAGLLPQEYLAHTAPAERRAAWHARLCNGAEAPLEVTLARVDGEPAGFACLMPNAEPSHGIYLDNLHVLPAFHGHGLGKRLLAHCAARVATGWPGRPLFLYVLDANDQAREFYRRLDSHESESFEDPFPGTDIIVAVRRVTWNDVPALLARLQPTTR